MFESRDRAGKARRPRLHWLVVKNGIVSKRLRGGCSKPLRLYAGKPAGIRLIEWKHDYPDGMLENVEMHPWIRTGGIEVG